MVWMCVHDAWRSRTGPTTHASRSSHSDLSQAIPYKDTDTEYGYGIRSCAQNTEYGYGIQIRNTDLLSKYRYGDEIRIRNTDLRPKYRYGYGIRIRNTDLRPKYRCGVRHTDTECGAAPKIRM
jgi:hypothetical protein